MSNSPVMDSESSDAFIALSVHASVAAAVCGAVASRQVAGTTDLRRLCTASGIAQSRATEVEEFLVHAAELQLFARRSELSWEPLNLHRHAALAPMFLGVALHHEHVHHDRDVVEVVLTKPPAPSRFNEELAATPGGSWGFIDTKEALPAIAEAAQHRFSVMTPFIDDVGAPILLNLFRCARPGIEKLLITRAEAGEAWPSSLWPVRAELRALDVQVLNFRVGRLSADGNEISHAKVVLADARMAYVGSLNMNRWSFQYSLEVGVRVQGAAAAQLSRVVEAARKMSTLIS